MRVTTHTLVHLAIEAPDAYTLPVLLHLNESEAPIVCYSAALFARYLQRQGTYSYEHIQRAIAGIGRLRDFYLLERSREPVEENHMRGLLEDFLFAYDHGSVLGWRPASNSQYQQTRAAVYQYVKFLFDTGAEAWAPHELPVVQACREAWQHSSHAEKSLLFHTKRRGRKKTQGRRKLYVGLHQYKPFPPKLVIPLIENTDNVRDKLFFALSAFGGRRQSENLNLFLSDVLAKRDTLDVVLRDPSGSPMEWTNHAGRRVKGLRREYLKTMFGLLPRPWHGARSSSAGWKNIKYDDHLSLSSMTYFIRESEVGPYLMDLHEEYLHEIRGKTRSRNHPYYFTSSEGVPLTVNALQKQFRLARARIERKFGVSLRGYGLHSLRHYYGFYLADVLGVDLLLIQKHMGHLNITSTTIYAHISPETASAALKDAERRRSGSNAEKLSPEEREAIKRDLMIVEPIPSGWKRGSTAFGYPDTSALTRRIK